MRRQENASGESTAKAGVQSLGFVVGICLGALTAFCFATGAAGGGETPPARLAGTLNPNTAPLTSLIRLPRIGLARAQAIIAFRERSRDVTGWEAPFRRPSDLQQIAGIGPRTVEEIAGWLRFNELGGEPTGSAEMTPSRH